MPNYIYVSLQDEDKVLIFRLDSGTGKLTPQGALPLPGGPSAMAMSPDRKVLYVSHRTVPGISSYQMDPNAGALTQTGAVTPEAAPTFLAPDRKGRFLLGAYYQGAHVGVHPLGADGSVGGAPVAWLETAVGAHAIQVDRSNRFVFVPHIARIADNVLQPPGDAYGPNAIYQFRFDETQGRLTPNTPRCWQCKSSLAPDTTASIPRWTWSTFPMNRAAASARIGWTPPLERSRRCKPCPLCQGGTPGGTPALRFRFPPPGSSCTCPTGATTASLGFR